MASVGDARVASTTRADYAAATATVLVGPDQHHGKVYELSGEDTWNYDDLAVAFATVLGREVTYQRATAEEHLAAQRQAGLDEHTAGFLVALDGNIRAGALELTTGDLARLAGRPTTALLDGLRPLA